MFASHSNGGAWKFDARAHRYPKEFGYIYTVEAFREVVARECSRTDRSGHGFSFVVLDLPVRSEYSALIEKTIDLVGDWLRITDVAGWLERNRRLAVLLYACRTEDAEKFAERLKKKCGLHELSSSIYFYPGSLPGDMLMVDREVADESQ